MPYISEGQHITSPVSIRDVQRCVPVSLVRTNSSTHQTEHVSSNDLGVLCGANIGDTVPASDGKGDWTVQSRTEINMWSVSKPVYFAKVAQLTDADLKTGRIISGYTTSYGIKKRASTAWSDYVNTSTGAVKSEPWQYDRAVADGVNVFRLTDLYNYWHK